MEFQVAHGSGVPSYLQLVQQVKEALRVGALQPGDRLPSASDAAACADVDRNTVLRAYRELALEGLAVVEPRRGTRVTRGLHDLTSRDAADLSFRVERWVSAARLAGLDDDGIVATVRLALRRSTQSSLRSGAGA